MKSVWPFRHLGLKIWSVVIAVMLWAIVAGEETVERGLRVPLELQQFPAGLELQADAPSVVDVRVRGGSSALSRLGPGDIVAVLDVKGARAGRRLYQLTPEQVRVPFGVQVTQVTPPGIALVFEPSAARQVRVSPTLEGNPSPGYVVGKVTVDPKTVEVVGPEGAVQRVSEAVTESVEISGADHDVTSTVGLGFADAAVRLRSPRTAVVTVQIIPGPVERELNAQPVHLEHLGGGLSAQAVPSAATLVLRGSRLGVSRLSAADVRVFVDVGGLGVGQYALPLQVTANSQDAGVARIDPATVQVRIVRAKN